MSGADAGEPDAGEPDMGGPKGKRQRAERRGRSGEAAAERWLVAKGWVILDRRRRTPLGEIDLVARDGTALVFVEVKWRRRAAELAFAIDERRLSRVAAAAAAVAHEYADGSAGGEGEVRIDVILLAPDARPEHIINAWQP